MSRVRVLATALCALGLQGLIVVPAMAFERIGLDPTQTLVIVEPQDVEHERTQGADGSVLVVGHQGARPGCPGVQAFVRKLDPDQTIAWTRSAGAGKDCDGDGLPDGGDPMFEGMTTLDPAYIQSSTVYDSIYVAEEYSLVTGVAVVVWEDGGELTAAWGGFILGYDPEGDLAADLYFGPPPTGPPVDIGSCDAICQALGQTSLLQWGGRAIALTEDEAGAPDGVVLAGWRQPPAGQSSNDKDIFLTELSLDLTTASWFQLFPYPGTDQPLAVAVADTGNVYATGYSGHDVFVACFDGRTGALTHLFQGGGPLDDWGETVEVTAAGEIEVKGKFTDSATFGAQTLEGDGLTEFRALLTPTLELIELEAIPEQASDGTGAPTGPGTQAPTQVPTPATAAASGYKAGVGLPGSPPPNGGQLGPQTNPPTGIEVLIGKAGSGTGADLVVAPDDKYLTLLGEPWPDHKKLQVMFTVPILPGASILKSVKLRLKSSFCTDLTISIGGGDAQEDTFYDIGEARICPLDEPEITFEIPSGIAEEQLGFSATSESSNPLLVLMSSEIRGDSACSPLYCPVTGADEAVNSAEVGSEYP